jgi:hypothetical protein
MRCRAGLGRKKNAFIYLVLHQESKAMAKEGWLPLEVGDYYYTEQGLIVFTAQYHLKRGYCCKSGCRHCPFGFPKPGAKKAG